MAPNIIRFQDPRAKGLSSAIDAAFKNENVDIHNTCKSVRRKQERLGVSGIHWIRVEYCGYAVEYPAPIFGFHQFDNDFELLKSYRPIVIDFVDQVRRYFTIWDEDQDSHEWEPTPWELALRWMNNVHWLEVFFSDNIFIAQETDTECRCFYPDNAPKDVLDDPNSFEYPVFEITIFGFRQDNPIKGAWGEVEPCLMLQLNNSRPMG